MLPAFGQPSAAGGDVGADEIFCPLVKGKDDAGSGEEEEIFFYCFQNREAPSEVMSKT